MSVLELEKLEGPLTIKFRKNIQLKTMQGRQTRGGQQGHLPHQ